MADRYSITRTPLSRRATSLALVLVTACSPTLAGAAAPTIPGFYGKVPMPGAPVSGTLPVVLPGSTPVGATLGAVGNTLAVNQTQAQATIDWSSFNIAPDSVVIFNQKQGGVPQPQWTALNRIHDANPSLIFGKIQADGKVYLINRNGILFGPGSQVNVHSLVASNLNITDANFQNGKLRFTTDPYSAGQGALSNDAYVSNYGTIETDSGGSVFLLGPNVVNAGTISSPSGKINLIGVKGDGEVETAELTVDAIGDDVTYTDLSVLGQTYNAEGGRLVTEGGGRIGMYGAAVQNDGLIRSVTAFKKGGVVILAARDKVTTGAGSVIASPIAESAETADPQFVFNDPEVIVKGVQTENGATPLSLVEHGGSIVAPSGSVTFTARDRIFLADGSNIDVSGLWLDRPASANQMEVQLNSIDLRDDYGQKGGGIKGEKINVDLLTGSSIGNLKNNYLTMQSGAEERSTAGGQIIFSDPTKNVVLGELIVKEGALIDFSGGGIRYGTGTMATSRLVSGNRLYGIGSAPQWVSYDHVADSQVREYARFGVKQEFSGLYFGGGSSVRDLTAARVAGSDAGSVMFNARVSVLDGRLDGRVTRGEYQTAVTPYTAADNKNYAISVTRGLEEPKGGSVTVGNELDAAPGGSSSDHEQDFITDSIVVRSAANPLEPGFGADSALERGTTEVSAALINAAGLSSLSLFANTTIGTEAGAAIGLMPGGSYTARGRRIEYAGSIEVAGGTVEMSTRPDVTSYQTLRAKPGENNPLYQSLVETVYLAPGSVISTAGERIDNSLGQGGGHGTHTAGGTILIQERTEEGTSDNLGSSPEGHALVFSAGAVLDVSGGWLIDSKGKVTGSNAGTLDLKGPTLSLAGEVRGHSLPGKNGGEIRLHAGEVEVASRTLYLPSNMPVDAVIPEYLRGRLVLGEDRLKDTGFSRITLTAVDDLTLTNGAMLTPSQAKLDMPVAALASQSFTSGNLVVPVGSDPMVPDYLGTTSVTLNAGRNIYEDSPLSRRGGDSVNNGEARIMIAAGAGVTVAAGGSVSVFAPKVDIAGSIEARGGSVTVKSTGYDLNLRSGAEILATGYNEPSSAMVAGLPAGSLPQAGGKVALESRLGNLVIEAGALVDVSGAGPVERLQAGADGVPVAVTSAGAPGSLAFSYAQELILDGEIDGRPRMDGMQGGSLTVTKLANDLTLTADDIVRYQQSGFDALTFKSSNGSLVFREGMDVEVDRSLTLDAKRIMGADGVDVALRSPWTTVQNTSIFRSGAPAPAGGQIGSLSLSAGFLDVKGSVLIDGFGEVLLGADRDLNFSDRTYTVGSNSNYWAGDLGVTGNLTLAASRVYPTTASAFTVTTPGSVRILPGETADRTPVYSAGGTLSIKAQGGIEHSGVLAAPQGSITLDGGEGRVTLAEGSSIDTSGSFAVKYGYYDGSFWKVKSDNFNNGGSEITSAPVGSVTLNADEVVVNEGAEINVSGGGSVFYANFQSGIDGSSNPLTVASPSPRYVVLPDRSVTLPGNAVYLEAVPELGLEAGVYSLLPADQYAFVPGALVVQDAGMQLVPGQQALSREGYLVVAGYGTVTGTSIGTDSRKGYSVRSAADVLKEGDFADRREFSSRNGGDITMSATSALMNGTLSGAALLEGEGGVLTLGARNVVVQSGAASTQTLVNETLVLDTASVSGKGFAELVIGSSADGPQTTVTVKEGATLAASSVTLKATGSVTIEKDASVLATGEAGSGIAAVEVPLGSFALNEGADVHASHGLSFDIGEMTLDGSFGADNSSLTLAADKIIFAPDGTPQGAGALYLTDSRWEQFDSYEELTLKSRGEMQFLNDVNLESAGSLTLDVGRFTGSDGAASVSFTAATRLTLTNSGATQAAEPVAGTTTLALNATEIVVAPRRLEDSSRGDIVFDRFASVAMNAGNADPKVASDILLSGAGSVATKGDLTLSGARVTTTYYRHDADPADPSDVAVPYTAAAIALSAGGDVSIVGNGGTAGGSVTPGGSLEIAGASITVGNTEPVKDADGKDVFNATVLEVPSGQLRLSATGDIAVTGKTSILAAGSKSKMPMQDDVYSYGPAGSIALESDTGAIRLAAGSTLDVSASDEGNAGSVSLSAAKGSVTLAGTLKGSAPSGQGGSFALDGEALAFVDQAPDGTPTLDGTGWLNGLSSTLDAGGFNDRIDIRSRSGNLALTEGKTLTGRDVTVAAEGADITITGTVNADTADGSGRIELYAGKNLTLGDKGKLTAMGTGEGSDGGSILLSSRDGSDNDKTFNGGYALTVAGGSTIDVSSHDADGTGGTVSFRAYQGKGSTGDATLNDVNMAAVQGTINGASAVTVEAVKAERFTGDTVLVKAKPAGDTTAGKVSLDDYTAAADTFMTGKNAAGIMTAADIMTRLNAGMPGSVTGLKAGIEIATVAGKTLTVGESTATGGLTLAARPGGSAAVLTLKSGGDLKIVQSLTDAPTSVSTLYRDTMQETTALNLVAGSDGGANYLGVAKGTGDISVENGRWIYTENAPMSFAAGNDATFRGSTTGPGLMINSDMKYNLGSYGGTLRGSVGGDLVLADSGSAIQTALGDIALRVGGDLNLGSQANTGAIRTTGEYDDASRIEIMPGTGSFADAGLTSYWTYHDGGSIALEISGSVIGNLNPVNGWDGAYYDDKSITGVTDTRLGAYPWHLAAGFGGLKEKGQTANIPVTVGIATMGGGDIDVRAGGAILTQIGAFGTRDGGDLFVTSGGDMVGRFRVMNGSAVLTSAGAFGKDSASNSTWKSVIEMGAARVEVAAQGDVALGSVLNPDNSRDRVFGSGNLKWNMTYSEDASAEIRSLAGNLTLFGKDDFSAYNFTGSDTLRSSLLVRQRILPANLTLSAGGDLGVADDFYLSPSHGGNLSLYAGGSIAGVLTGVDFTGFKMVDVDNVAGFYGRQSDTATQHSGALSSDPSGTESSRRSAVNHLLDKVPVVVAAKGDINTLKLVLNKQAEIRAGGNIVNLNLLAQNTSPGSVTLVSAEKSIDQGMRPNNTSRITVGGPGTMLVEAGENIDLGNSKGIESIGNSYNSGFTGENTDSNVVITLGVKETLLPTDPAAPATGLVSAYFETLRLAGEEYALLKASGESEQALERIEQARIEIAKYFDQPEKEGTGNLTMVDSLIRSKKGDIYLLARGDVNVGRSSISDSVQKDTGITTTFGGNLSIYTGGDLHVNESRTMTFMGGDIVIWSDRGDINAGRGSKTALSSGGAPEEIRDENGVLIGLLYPAPALGSGVRASTYDPDGSTGPRSAPEPGDIYLLAPQGIIDAGEAGIAGGKVTLGATEIHNVNNISFGAGSVGVATGDSSISLGALAGNSSLTESSKMMEQVSSLGTEKEKNLKEKSAADDFFSKWLDLRILSFDSDAEADSEKDTKEEQDKGKRKN